MVKKLLSIDPGQRPGLCYVWDGELQVVGYRPGEFDVNEYDHLVIEAQHAATHLYRGGKKVRVSRASQQGLSFTAGRLFERFNAAAKFRIPVADWRRRLWPTASRLTKPVVLARLRQDFEENVIHIPKTHQGDCLEACGIAKAWLTMTDAQRARYHCE